jgi:hypothetical protein
MKAIGGYFETEKVGINNKPYHSSNFLFDCGRSALEMILLQTKPSKVYIPYYCCNALLQPLKKLSIPFSFYAINDSFEIQNKVELNKNEYLLYINFFGIKNRYSNKLIDIYKKKLILDNTMAFFFNQKNESWNFNSCRKFFGLPDGAYMHAPKNIFAKKMPTAINENLNPSFLFYRNEGLIEEGYKQFLINENAFGKKMYKVSKYSTEILSSLPYKKIKKIRNENFQFLHNYLGDKNSIKLTANANGAMFYPFMPSKAIAHEIFWNKKYYIPKFWPECKDRNKGFEWEKKLSQLLLPLPLDHRYTPNDLKKILKLIFEHQ